MNDEPIDVPSEGEAATTEHVCGAMDRIRQEVAAAEALYEDAGSPTAPPDVDRPMLRYLAWQRLMRAEDGLRRLLDWMGRDWEEPE